MWNTCRRSFHPHIHLHFSVSNIKYFYKVTGSDLIQEFHLTTLRPSFRPSRRWRTRAPSTSPPCPPKIGTGSCWKTTSPWKLLTLEYHHLSNAELSYNIQNDWDNSWRLARLPGLESDQISFLWRTLHNLLPTQSRVSRIMPDQDPACKLCSLPVDDLPHLFNCRFSIDVCQSLLRSVQSVMPDATPQKILLLSLGVEPAYELPVVWLVSSTLLYVWAQKISKKQCTLVETRAVLEARVNLLRKGKKFQNVSTFIDELFINFS